MSLYTSPNGETFTFSFFNSLNEFNTYITGESYNFDICFGVNVVQEDSLTFSTTLMYNTTANSNKTSSLLIKNVSGMLYSYSLSSCVLNLSADPDIPDTADDEVLDYKPQNYDDYYKPYLESGSL